MSYIPLRGDIIGIQLNPTIGHEQHGFRPAIVLSDYSYNKDVKMATICPITSQIKGYPFEVKIPDGLKVNGVVLAHQIRSISLEKRGVKFKCKASWELYLEVWKMVNTHIGPRPSE